jgi:hypothetical protein
MACQGGVLWGCRCTVWSCPPQQGAGGVDARVSTAALHHCSPVQGHHAAQGPGPQVCSVCKAPLGPGDSKAARTCLVQSREQANSTIAHMEVSPAGPLQPAVPGVQPCAGTNNCHTGLLCCAGMWCCGQWPLPLAHRACADSSAVVTRPRLLRHTARWLAVL